jgi:hypothetical protein
VAELPKTCEILDRELRALRELIDARFKAAELANALSASALNVRFENVNEWRAQLDRERREFASKLSVEAIVSRLDRHQSWQDKADGAINLLRIATSASVIGVALMLWRMFTGKP